MLKTPTLMLKKKHAGGRPPSGIQNANNFRYHILNRFKINYQRVRSTSWYLIQWPLSDEATQRLAHYQRYSLRDVGVKLDPFDYVIFVGYTNETRPPREEVKSVLALETVNYHTSTHYSRAALPAWWQNARHSLEAAGIKYDIVDSGVTTESELMQRNGLVSIIPYDPHSLNKDFTSGYKLVKLDISNPPPTMRHTILTEDGAVYAIFRSTEYGGSIPPKSIQPQAIGYANSRLVQYAVMEHHGLLEKNSHEWYMYMNLCRHYKFNLYDVNEQDARDVLKSIYINCVDVKGENWVPPIHDLQDCWEALHSATQSGIPDTEILTQSGINDENSEGFLTDKE